MTGSLYPRSTVHWPAPVSTSSPDSAIGARINPRVTVPAPSDTMLIGSIGFSSSIHFANASDLPSSVPHRKKKRKASNAGLPSSPTAVLCDGRLIYKGTFVLRRLEDQRIEKDECLLT
ncbi:hypothetical protein KC316_g20 [Hortaea werneckii]|nr:hypothetical protein KC316_g20 [Hortaea werneckii]